MFLFPPSNSKKKIGGFPLKNRFNSKGHCRPGKISASHLQVSERAVLKGNCFWVSRNEQFLRELFWGISEWAVLKGTVLGYLRMSSSLGNCFGVSRNEQLRELFLGIPEWAELQGFTQNCMTFPLLFTGISEKKVRTAKQRTGENKERVYTYICNNFHDLSMTV